jgi:hypothetical protein
VALVVMEAKPVVVLTSSVEALAVQGVTVAAVLYPFLMVVMVVPAAWVVQVALAQVVVKAVKVAMPALMEMPAVATLATAVSPGSALAKAPTAMATLAVEALAWVAPSSCALVAIY